MLFVGINLRSRLLFLAALAVIFVACGQPEPPVAESSSASPTEEKVPLTSSSGEAIALYLEGQAYADHLRTLEARNKALAAIEMDPEFAMAYRMLAFNAQSTTQFFDAVGKAEEHMGNASEGEQLYVRALIAGAENDQEVQFEALAGVMRLYPGDERTHMAMANYFNGQQDFENAVLHFGHATTINPEFAGAFNSLGYAHRSNGNLDAAKDALARYVELVPDEANPYDSYAELLMEMGQYEESIENYRKAIEINENFPTAYIGISINESLRGNADAAQEATAQMLATAQTNAQKQRAMFRSVTSHLFAGNIDAALAKSKEAIDLAATDENHSAMGGFLEYMGDIMLKTGNSAEAIKYFDQALEHRQMANINDANKRQAERAHFFKTAMAAMIGGDNEAAADRSSKYIAAAEEEGTAFERRRIHEMAAFLAMFNEDYEVSAAEFDRASQLNPIVLYWSAVVNNSLGNTEKAAELANLAANRNTLSSNLPFFRNEAEELLAALKAM
jgi:tetratricopeptide (TPR) repeat protein